MPEKQQLENQPKRSSFARAISALMLIGILLFIIPGTDNALGLKAGTLSSAFLILAFAVALISFVIGPPKPRS